MRFLDSIHRTTSSFQWSLVLVGASTIVACTTSPDSTASTSVPDSSVVATGDLVHTRDGEFVLCEQSRAFCVVGVYLESDSIGDGAEDLLDVEFAGGDRSSGAVRVEGNFDADRLVVSSVDAAESSTDSAFVVDVDGATVDIEAISAGFIRGPDPSLESLFTGLKCGGRIIYDREDAPGCELVTTSLGLVPARWWVADRSGTVVELHGYEEACANGEAPGDRLVDPLIYVTETAVEIHVLVAPLNVPGVVECPPNPTFVVPVELPETAASLPIVGQLPESMRPD